MGQVWEVVYDRSRVYYELNIKKPLTHGQQTLKYDAFEDEATPLPSIKQMLALLSKNAYFCIF